MNNVSIKAELWDLCIDNGMFNMINKDNVSKIQSIFETTIQLFNDRKEPIEILKREFMVTIKEELKKLNSFEEKEKEYKQLLNNSPPPKIDFSDKIDEPIKNIDALLEKTQNNRQEVFKNIEYIPPENNGINWAKVIKTQNDILIKILETQNKILVLLQK